jgi:hypothetical protein
MNSNNDQSAHPAMLDAALSYTKLDYAIFPVHTVDNGMCSCGNPSCSSPGKHPWTARGVKNATTEEMIICQWWEQHPEANIGIATGATSNLVVLDVDPRHGGDASLDALVKQHGALPETATSATGGGGWHFLFRYPDQPVRNKVGLAPGLDIRADGGYIVAPPSRHASGQQYRWQPDAHPDRVPLAAVPEWLLDLMTIPDTKAIQTAQQDLSCIPEGQRNHALASLAGTMRRRGFSRDAIAAALLMENETRCEPPLPEDEVVRIASSIAQYEPGASSIGYPSFSVADDTASTSHSLEHRTDAGNARRLAARHGQDLRYCPLWKKWLVWDGGRWVVDQTGEVMRKAKETVVGIYNEVYQVDVDKEEWRVTIEHAKRSESEPRLKAMINLAESELGIPILPQHLDTDPWLLNVVIGTIDLRTGKLREHRREELITKLAPVVYDPEADCPVWLAFLERIMCGNEALITFLQRAIGYALTGDTREGGVSNVDMMPLIPLIYNTLDLSISTFETLPKLRYESGRIDEVTEHDRQLAPFSIGYARFGLGRRFFLDSRLYRLRGRFWLWGSFTNPDETSTILINHRVREKQLFFQVFQSFVIKSELSPERPVSQPASLLEEFYNLVGHLIEFHHLPSTAASAASVSGSQNVISISRYMSIAVHSSVRACSICPVCLYSLPRPR